MKETDAALVGFGTASVVPAAVLAISSPLGGEYSVASILMTFVVLYTYSLIATVVLGLPAFLLLRPFRPGHWWSVSAVGFLLGVVVAVILQSPSLPGPRDFITLGLTGALTALVFWLIWRRSAPPARLR